MTGSVARGNPGFPNQFGVGVPGHPWRVWSHICCGRRTILRGHPHSNLLPLKQTLPFDKSSLLTPSCKCRTLKQALERAQPWGHHSHAKAPRFYHCFYISDSHLNFRFLCFPDSCFIHANHRNCPQNLERKLDWCGMHTSNNGQFLYNKIQQWLI